MADEMVDDRMLAVARESAARIADLTLRQVDYWASTAGRPVSEILQAFPSLTEADVLAVRDSVA